MARRSQRQFATPVSVQDVRVPDDGSVPFDIRGERILGQVTATLDVTLSSCSGTFRQVHPPLPLSPPLLHWSNSNRYCYC